MLYGSLRGDLPGALGGTVRSGTKRFDSRDRGRSRLLIEGLRHYHEVNAEKPDHGPGRVIGEVVQTLHLLGSQ